MTQPSKNKGWPVLRTWNTVLSDCPLHSCFRQEHTCASEAIARVPLLAEAAVGAHGVLAVCVLAAHVGSIGAFIQVLRKEVTCHYEQKL